MNSTSKIRVYTNGIAVKGTGAYAYIVIESKDCGDIRIGEGGGRVFSPSVLKAKFTQAGPAKDEMRMKMRAVYEGVRHCPDGVEVEVYTDNFLIDSAMMTTTAEMEDGDIAVRFRKYVSEHRITPVYIITKYYNEKDLPANDHDEWTWWAHQLCEDAIKRYKKENHIKDEDADKTHHRKR